MFTFSQLMFAGISQQICGLIADSTWTPIALVMLIFALMGLAAALVAAVTLPKSN